MPGRSVKEIGERPARVRLAGVLALSAVAAAPSAAVSQEAGRHPGSADPPRWTVVLDPGHGGIDKGAVGSTGLEEKALVLSIARTIRRFLSRDRRFRVILTRDGDRYIRLRKRYELARKRRAGLFVSIHANANPFARYRGLSVHTLSARASDRLAARLAERENRSDAAAGLDLGGAGRSVSSILMDLVKRETRAGSARISSLIVRSARNRVRLLRKPQRSANFAVLRAPDVPSVLVELGFLTNPRDEQLLRSPKYRKRVAAVLARAIARFFRETAAAAGAGYGAGYRAAGGAESRR